MFTLKSNFWNRELSKNLSSWTSNKWCAHQNIALLWGWVNDSSVWWLNIFASFAKMILHLRNIVHFLAINKIHFIAVALHRSGYQSYILMITVVSLGWCFPTFVFLSHNLFFSSTEQKHLCELQPVTAMKWVCFSHVVILWLFNYFRYQCYENSFFNLLPN